MKKSVLFSVLFLMLLFMSCQNKQEPPKVKEATPKVEAIVEVAPIIEGVDSTFKEQITDIFTAYNGLKNALVASDSVTSITAAKATLTALDKGDMGLLKKPASHKVWMKEKPLLTTQLNKLIKSETLAQQRQIFLDISSSMIHLVEAFGVNQKVMVQFCPMADDFKGGFWLSTDVNIKNPYFGSKMLTCGSTKRIIK
jgi:membrane fusion protein, copper/silver efflux system